MADISYDKLWRSEYYCEFSAKDKTQDLNQTQLKLEVNYSYKKEEKISKKFEPFNEKDVVSKT